MRRWSADGETERKLRKLGFGKLQKLETFTEESLKKLQIVEKFFAIILCDVGKKQYICRVSENMDIKEMKKILIATHNKHKCEEIRAMLKGIREVVSLDDIALNDDIPETGTTFRENARQKADYVRTRAGEEMEILADDSGLEVMALNGEPGVWSARYAGEKCTDRDNIDKLLGKLKGVEERRARFVTVLAYMHDGETEYFEGEVRGRIIDELRGSEGFGYDPVFVPEGETQTFGELSAEKKNGMSHRANAIKKLREKIQ